MIFAPEKNYQGMERMYKQILKMYFLVIVLGSMIGIVGSYFQLSISYVQAYLTDFYHFLDIQRWPVSLVSAIVSMVMVFIAWLMVRYIAPEAAGSGIPQIEGALLHERPVFWKRLLPVKFIGGVLSISANMLLGREGPTIQMGGNLGEMIGGWFNIKRYRRDTLIAAGAAAGLSVAFNAPLAGVVFVIEEMRRPFRFSFTNFSIVAIGCVSATIVEHLIMGSNPAIVMPVFELPSLHSLVWFFLFGIIVGFAGLLFNNTLVYTLKQTDRFSRNIRITFVLVIGALVGYLAIAFPDLAGGGYELISQVLVNRPSLYALIVIFIIRFYLGLICYNTGVPGGIFAPMLALGTVLGIAYSYILIWSVDPSIHPAMFAVAGMGAFFSASVRAPLTGIVLVVEMTQNYLLILPLMVTCLTSTTVVQCFMNPPIYSQLLHRLMNVKLTR